MKEYIKEQNKSDFKALILRIKNSIYRSDFILGKEVGIFENSFSKLCNVKYSISCGNGTDALILALMSLDLKKNDEVILPAFSYYSTLSSIISLKLKPVFVDINKNHPNINLIDLKKKITKKTRVIIGVHLFGSVENFGLIKSIVKKKAIRLIEDASQAHGAYVLEDNNKNNSKNKMVGSLGDLGCFSLYPTKNLGALGDAGIITTNNYKLYKKLKLLRNLGSPKKNLHTIFGLNSRMDTIQASILNFKITRLKKSNNLRKKIAKIYLNNIQNKNIEIVKHSEGSVYHQFVILCKSRKKLIKYLSKKNIYYDIHYPYTLNKFKFLNLKYKKLTFVNAEEFSKSCLSIPMHPNMPLSNARRVCSILNKY
jgi:dTDP-4-amino-4,6-dideoxygalactose transaminase